MSDDPAQQDAVLNVEHVNLALRHPLLSVTDHFYFAIPPQLLDARHGYGVVARIVHSQNIGHVAQLRWP